MLSRSLAVEAQISYHTTNETRKRGMDMKRFWSLLLCLTLALGPLAGCGGQKGGVVPIDDPAADGTSRSMTI